MDAQFMAVALATYFTSSQLAGRIGVDYGFNVTSEGIGLKQVNVGTGGAAFGAADHSTLTIMQLLKATNSFTDVRNSEAGFVHIYDQNGDGILDSHELLLRLLANDLYLWINESGQK